MWWVGSPSCWAGVVCWRRFIVGVVLGNSLDVRSARHGEAQAASQRLAELMLFLAWAWW